MVQGTIHLLSRVDQTCLSMVFAVCLRAYPCECSLPVQGTHYKPRAVSIESGFHSLNLAQHNVGMPRTYSTTTKGDTPNASNVSNPQAGSTQESDVKTSRAMEGTTNQDNASVQSPVSQGNIQSEGEKTPDNDELKQNPDKPASEKRNEVESLGKRPMGPEDNQ